MNYETPLKFQKITASATTAAPTGQGRAVRAVAAGDQRVNAQKVQALVGEKGQALVGDIRRADADWAQDQTGDSIGGVAPVAHRHPAIALLDMRLRRFGAIWAAAGHPRAVFSLHPGDLSRLCLNAQWADVL